jgi:hypothetical protein
MAPGDEYWARFGHNAILIDDGQAQTLYNYGYFDFEQPGFLVRFLRGRMLYRLVALPLHGDLRGYDMDGRGVILQWLAIEPERARALAAFLDWNARPENADYRYDYFAENCSTKVRDALDRAFDGALHRNLSGRSQGYSFRDEARRLAAPLPWLYLGIDLGLGPFTDKPTSLWEQAFVPQRLREALTGMRDSSGAPWVTAEIELLPHRLQSPHSIPPDWRMHFVFAGLALALLAGYALRPNAGPRLRTASLALTIGWILLGLIGLGLIGLWSLTDHVAAWGNENVLLFNPLCLALLPAAAALGRGRPVPRWSVRVAVLIALTAWLALFLKFLPFRIQSNGDWIALLLPLHAVLAWRLSSRSSA